MVERDFFKDPFTDVEIGKLLEGKPASDMFNFRSPSFKKLGMDREKLTDDKMIEMMLAEPRLIRRPVVQIDKKIYFGADVNVLKDVLDR